MPKGYIIVRMTVTDPDIYKEYAAMASEAMRKYGCTPLVRGGRCEALEGEGVMTYDLGTGGDYKVRWAEEALDTVALVVSPGSG